MNYQLSSVKRLNMTNKIKSDVTDLKLAREGKRKIEWAGAHMPVLSEFSEKYREIKPLEGITIGACLHVTTETANLMITLNRAGADVCLSACNPLSTQDEIAASLVADYGISVFARRAEDNKTYYEHIEEVLKNHPQITMDDGGDLISYLHTKKRNQLADIIGSTEETTTGVIRLKAMEKDKALEVPVVAVNYSQTKHMFDNRYGTGQSTLDGILRATNILLAGKRFVVCGYGWCGRGLASRARGMGALVFITEVDPVKALEAVMDGFSVVPIDEAAGFGDIFVTVTGDKEVITFEHMKKMKDGAILANSGHFNAEVSVEQLKKEAMGRKVVRPNVEEYIIKGKRGEKKRLYILGEGRLINLVAAEGHPAEVMDMSFANQFLAAMWLVKNKGKLANRVYRLPEELDMEIAAMKLSAMGIKFDRLTAEQKRYLGSWQEGT